jgi:hypothetical protein
MQVKTHLHNNAIIQLHAGNTSIWSAPWCPIWENIHDHLLLPITQSPLLATVAQLWHPNSHTWNINYITTIFDNHALQAITSQPTMPSSNDDTIRWAHARDGKCTTKNIFKHLCRQETIQLPHQGSRSLTQHAKLILQKVWRSKELPPLIKTFT